MPPSTVHTIWWHCTGPRYLQSCFTRVADMPSRRLRSSGSDRVHHGHLVQARTRCPWPSCTHGRRSRGDRGTCPPRIWSRGTIMQIVPRRFCHISTKMSVLWPSENAQIHFWPGLRPGPHWRSSRRSPRPLVGWRGDTPPHILPTRHQSTFGPRHASPHNSSQIYAYGCTYRSSVDLQSPVAHSVSDAAVWNDLPAHVTAALSLAGRGLQTAPQDISVFAWWASQLAYKQRTKFHKPHSPLSTRL